MKNQQFHAFIKLIVKSKSWGVNSAELNLKHNIKNYGVVLSITFNLLFYTINKNKERFYKS